MLKSLFFLSKQTLSKKVHARGKVTPLELGSGEGSAPPALCSMGVWAGSSPSLSLGPLCVLPHRMINHLRTEAKVPCKS